jgi:hypothetical protein
MYLADIIHMVAIEKRLVRENYNKKSYRGRKTMYVAKEEFSVERKEAVYFFHHFRGNNVLQANECDHLYFQVFRPALITVYYFYCQKTRF